ncbi:MAG: 23S rRNA (adenine(1618)-N(6))-methyltransferase RlmF [Methylophilaceae bacterium]
MKLVQQEAKGLHPNNLHNHGYDFAALIQSYPALQPYVKANKYGNESIDFSNAKAVKALNSALLKHHYDVDAWDIPDGFLCPPIPGRVDYIHYVAELLKAPKVKDSKVTGSGANSKPIKLLDIGTGASGIYALLACQAYGWDVTATDVNPLALDNVASIAQNNLALKGELTLRLQQDKSHIFEGVIETDDYFDVSVCNPPFHGSLAGALSSNQKKRDNLARNRNQKVTHKTRQDTKGLNFGGLGAELWCDGGERTFLRTMITESQHFAQQCRWFTTLVSRTEYLDIAQTLLSELNVTDVREIEMHQGNKITRILAWTFI